MFGLCLKTYTGQLIVNVSYVTGVRRLSNWPKKTFWIRPVWISPSPSTLYDRHDSISVLILLLFSIVDIVMLQNRLFHICLAIRNKWFKLMFLRLRSGQGVRGWDIFYCIVCLIKSNEIQAHEYLVLDSGFRKPGWLTCSVVGNVPSDRSGGTTMGDVSLLSRRIWRAKKKKKEIRIARKQSETSKRINE